MVYITSYFPRPDIDTYHLAWSSSILLYLWSFYGFGMLSELYLTNTTTFWCQPSSLGWTVEFDKWAQFQYSAIWGYIRVRTGPWKPGKSWNLKIWIPDLENPGIFVEIWVYLSALKIREFIEKVLEFDIGRSWKVLEYEMSKCVLTLYILNNIYGSEDRFWR